MRKLLIELVEKDDELGRRLEEDKERLRGIGERLRRTNPCSERKTRRT